MKRETITLTVRESNESCIPVKQYFARLLLAGIMLVTFSAYAKDVPTTKNQANGSDDEPDTLSAGFLFDRFKLTLEDGFRTEAAGPFYYSQQADSGNVWAIPPLFSDYHNPSLDAQEYDSLYPLFTDGRYGHERRWQFFQILNFSWGLEPDDARVKQFTLFPIYFQQRSTDPDLNYTAFVPFYGRLKHRLFKDEIYFIMFPGYVQTRKRDIVTDNYFFPFVDVHHGDGMRGWQVWPFVGREHKVITTVTNGFGDAITIPGHDHSFYMWPFYFSQDNGIGSDDPEKLRASIPLFAYTRSQQRNATTVLWPFFTVIDERSRKYHEWQMPWPVIIFARGEGKHTSRVFPLFSRSHNDVKEQDSYVWPLYIYSRLHSDPLDQRRDRVLFFLYYRYAVKNTETGHQRVRLDMWPFFEWHRDFNGDERLQVLAPLEPAVPDNSRIERNWSPLWSVWRAQSSPERHTSSQSLLWNLYRHDTGPDYRKLSVFFGLYQSEAQGKAETIRLFHVPIAHSRSK